MGRLNRVFLTLLILVAAAAVALFLRARGDVRSQDHRFGSAVRLEDSIEPLAAEFNRTADRPRLLMVLAPACPVCLAGIETVQRELLAGDSELAVLVVWMEALPYDITRNPARRIEILAGDPRVTQFYDSRQLTGRQIAELLDWSAGKLAWDVYLFFPAGAQWDEFPPQPSAWFHQRHDADPAHFRTGPDLAEALRCQALRCQACKMQDSH